MWWFLLHVSGFFLTCDITGIEKTSNLGLEFAV